MRLTRSSAYPGARFNCPKSGGKSSHLTMYNVGRKGSEMDTRKLRSRAQEIKISLILGPIPEAREIIVVKE